MIACYFDYWKIIMLIIDQHTYFYPEGMREQKKIFQLDN